VEVHHEERLVGQDLLAALVLLLLDATVAAGEFGAQGVGDLGDVPCRVEGACQLYIFWDGWMDGWGRERMMGRLKEGRGSVCEATKKKKSAKKEMVGEQ
jgi:hypothetical protein